MISKTKKYLSLVLSLVFLLALLPAGASAADVIAAGDCGAAGGNLTWTLDSDGVLTVEGTGAMADFGEGAPWMEYAFSEDEGSSIRSIVISDGVTSIGEYAFRFCSSALHVAIPDTVASIGAGAFSYSGIESVTIPASVTSISEDTFYQCFNLTSVSLPSSVTSIGEAAFAYCMQLADLIIPDSVTSIGEAAFYGCHALVSLEIPAAVTSIGMIALRNCGMLEAINVAPDNRSYCSIDGVLFDKGLTTLLQCPDAKTGACSIPASVTAIDEAAFNPYGGSANISDIYYEGTEAMWSAIELTETDRTTLADVTIHFGSLTPGGGEEAPVPPASAPVVQVSTQKLAVDGVVKDIEHYNIDGSNYFKLRDLACLLIGTYSAFDVGYDSDTRTVTVTTGVDYTPLPTDLQIGADQSASAVVSTQALAIDGKTVDLTAYNIGGSNYFMLRDLAPYLDFGVNYDAETRTAIIVTE